MSRGYGEISRIKMVAPMSFFVRRLRLYVRSVALQSVDESGSGNLPASSTDGSSFSHEQIRKQPRGFS